MAEQATIARPYARAAFEHAQAGGALGAWQEMLDRAAAAVQDERVAGLLDNPRVTVDALVALVQGIAGDATATDGSNFLRLLAENGRLALLPDIAAQFIELRAAIENFVEVELVSAVPLDEPQRAKFAAAIEKRFGRQVHLKPSVDAALVGGAIVRAGDVVIDGSVRGRLERLRDALVN